MFSAIVDFIFPPRCPGCEAYVEYRGGWCEDCLRKDTGLRRLALPRELAKLVSEGWSLAHYRGGVRTAIRRLKYQGERCYLPAIQTLLKAGDDIVGRLPRETLVVPVPLAAEKLKERGFNQTLMIFEPWLRSHGHEIAEVLIRRRTTRPLYELRAAERQSELKGAFALAEDSAEKIGGCEVLLIDDIMTTGSTLYECVRVLKRAKVRAITLLVVASEHD